MYSNYLQYGTHYELKTTFSKTVLKIPEAINDSIGRKRIRGIRIIPHQQFNLRTLKWASNEKLSI
jgi:hypothetical protein